MHQFNRLFIALCLLLIISNIIGSPIACDCPAGECCSQRGYCGEGEDYCGDGCQAGPCSSGGGPVLNETFTGRMTWYDVSVGLTACGSQHGDDELVLALNAAQFDPYTPGGNPNKNTLCGHTIQIHGPHGSAQVRLFDRCPGCPYAGLDLSPAAFKVIGGSLDIGVVQASWNFV